jgi:RNA polymerase sigma-70 factor (ECF subfamily)
VTTTETTTGATTEAATATSLEFEFRGRPDTGAAAGCLAALFDEHAPVVLGICRSMLRDHHEAEDAAQQAFLSAYRALLGGAVPRDGAAWIATIARNECRTRIRDRMREPLALSDATEAPTDAFAETVRSADVASLRRALAELPLKQRRAFMLREFSGLSYDELAVALGVSLPAVESLLFRARQQLRGRLQTAIASVNGLLALPWSGGGEASAGSALKIASLPLAAKLASAGAGVALVAASAVAIVPRHVHHATVGHEVVAHRAAPVDAALRPDSAPVAEKSAPRLAPRRAAPVAVAPPRRVRVAAPVLVEHHSAERGSSESSRGGEPEHSASPERSRDATTTTAVETSSHDGSSSGSDGGGDGSSGGSGDSSGSSDSSGGGDSSGPGSGG